MKFTAMCCCLPADEWKISITTGIYNPPKHVAEELSESEELNANNNADERHTNRRQYRIPPSPPTCGLLVVLYGDLGKTIELPLEPSSSEAGISRFKPGCAAEFKVKFVYV